MDHQRFDDLDHQRFDDLLLALATMTRRGGTRRGMLASFAAMAALVGGEMTDAKKRKKKKKKRCLGGKMRCGNGCCLETQGCRDGSCQCREDELACGDGCCLLTQGCAADVCQCETTEIACGAECCPPGQSCVDGQCGCDQAVCVTAVDPTDDQFGTCGCEDITEGGRFCLASIPCTNPTPPTCTTSADCAAGSACQAVGCFGGKSCVPLCALV